MAVVFNIKDLEGKEAKIDKMLTFIPKKLPFMKNNFGPALTEPVKMYLVAGDKISLPYRFSSCFFNKKYHQTNTYPSIFEDKTNKFSGKLLDRQKEPFEQAIKYLYTHSTVTIALYPGFGKTFLGCMLSWYINKKTCILVHRENVGKQWIKTFQRYFDLEDKYIWFVDNKPNPEAKILICMNGRTDKIPNTLKKEIGCLIIDEAHCFCSSSNVKPLLSFSPKYIIAETATPVKDNNMHRMIQSICGTHYIQKLSTKKFKFIIIKTNLEYPVNTDKNPFGLLLTKQGECEIRNQIIIDILKANKERKTIVACSRKNHCKTLHDLLKEENIESAELYGTKKNYQTKNILIGTGSKMGVGFDEANFCDDYDGRASDLLLMCYTFASWAPFEQVRGRGLRSDNPIVVVFNDNNNMTKKHIRKMKKWAIESNGEIIDINIDKTKDLDFSKIE